MLSLNSFSKIEKFQPTEKESSEPESPDKKPDQDSLTKEMNMPDKYDLMEMATPALNEKGIYDFDLLKKNLTDCNGVLFAHEVSSRQKGNFWIYASVVNENDETMVYYRSTLDDDVLFKIKLPQRSELFQRIAIDQASKKITSRSMGVYPNELALAYDEVWPKDSKILVVGDPSQMCDREGITIIDYEYMSEIMPPFLEKILENDPEKLSEESIKQSIRAWFEDLHFGDNMAVKKRYGQFTPESGDPINIWLDEVVNALATDFIDFINLKNSPKEYKRAAEEAKKVKNFLRKTGDNLRNGKWEISDFDQAPEIAGDPKAKENLLTFYDYKQSSVERGSDIMWQDWKKMHTDYITRINETLPEDKILENKDKIQTLEMLVDECVQAKSGKRRQHLLNRVYDAYLELKKNAGSPDEYETYFDYTQNPWVSYDIDLAKRYPEEGPLGFFQPGQIMNARVDNFIKEGIDLMTRSDIYFHSILPAILEENKRINDMLGDKMDTRTKEIYLKSFQKALIKEKLYNVKAQKATPVHGFFPDNVSLNQPQDRIIALYSVSTHVWDTFQTEDDFRKNITDSIKFLKKGGKYILGPINWMAHRTIFQNAPEIGGYIGFKGKELKKALDELNDKGLIDYYFVKVDVSTDEEYQTKDFGDKPDDSAFSLVIEKLSD